MSFTSLSAGGMTQTGGARALCRTRRVNRPVEFQEVSMNVDHVAQFPQKTWFRERLPRPVAPAFGAITIGLALAAMLAACSPSVPSMIGHGAGTPAGTPAGTTAATTAAGRNCGPLHAAGAHLVDAQGNPANLSGVSWFGSETRSLPPRG